MTNPIDELVQTLITVVKRIRSGQLHNEAHVKLSAIVPILQRLGWDYSNPSECRLEYPLPHPVSGRVDFALLGANGKPRVFIEAKMLGRIDEAGEEQLFRYAYGQGVPLLILTDGDVWDFYLSMMEGRPAERRFYRVALTSGKATEYAKNFEQFLGKASVCSGDARNAAEREHTNKAIPKAWRALLTRPDPGLRAILSAAVEKESGTAPEQDDLDKFLGKQLHVVPFHTDPPPKILPSDDKKISPSGDTKIFKKIIGYTLDGKHHKVRSGARTLAEVLKEFHRRDPEFMSRFAARTMGHKHRLVAQRREDLATDRHRGKSAIDMSNGWWIGIHHSTAHLHEYIKRACAIAGVTFGSQLTITYRDNKIIPHG